MASPPAGTSWSCKLIGADLQTLELLQNLVVWQRHLGRIARRNGAGRKSPAPARKPQPGKQSACRWPCPSRSQSLSAKWSAPDRTLRWGRRQSTGNALKMSPNCREIARSTLGSKARATAGGISKPDSCPPEESEASLNGSGGVDVLRRIRHHGFAQPQAAFAFPGPPAGLRPGTGPGLAGNSRSLAF